MPIDGTLFAGDVPPPDPTGFRSMRHRDIRWPRDRPGARLEIARGLPVDGGDWNPGAAPAAEA